MKILKKIIQHNLVYLFINFSLIVLMAQSSNAQNIGIGTQTPDVSAMLEVEASDKGILIPRTDTTSVNTAGTPATGLIIYQSINNKFYYFDGTKWLNLATKDAVFERNGTTVRQLDNYDTDDFIFGRDELPENGEYIHDTLLFFDKSKAAFRGGKAINSTFWSPDSIGIGSFAFGNKTKAKGDYSIALGYLTETLGSSSYAHGNNTKATGMRSTAWGHQTLSSGSGSTSWGFSNLASGSFSTCWGLNSKATDYADTAWGSESEASGGYSTSFGYRTKAKGFASTAWGNNTEALESLSTAWGDTTKASGRYSTAWGALTEAKSGYETVLGRWNTDYSPISIYGWSSNDRLFVVGNGTSSSSRSNALTILKNGNTGLGAENPLSKLSVGGNGNSEWTVYALNSNYGGRGAFFEASQEEGIGVYGLASNTDYYYPTYGGYFESLGEEGVGVLGKATKTGFSFGIGGKFESNGDHGAGVSGYTSGTSGIGVSGTAGNSGDVLNYGGRFKAYGEQGIGVYGAAQNTGNVENYGGYFISSGQQGTAVYAHAESTSSLPNIGGHFIASGQQSLGVYGVADNINTNNFHMGGQFEAKGGLGFGVYGLASKTGNIANWGGSFSASGDVGYGVSGSAVSTANAENYGGHFTAEGGQSRGVFGLANNSGDYLNYGGYFKARGSQGMGVYGEANQTGDFTNYGGHFISAGDQGIGIYGESSSISGLNYGGKFIAHGESARAVYGYAMNTGSTETYGGYFKAEGTQSIGVYGFAAGHTDVNYGVYGQTLSEDGFGGYFVGKGYFLGKVGIGTNTPYSKLEISTTGSEVPFQVEVDGFVEFRAHSNGGISVGTSSLPPGEGILANGNIEPFGDLTHDLGTPDYSWDDVYADDYHNQGASSFSDRNPLEEIMLFPPKTKQPGSRHYKTKTGEIELDPTSMPPGLSTDHSLLIDEISSYNYKTNYEQQVLINTLLLRLNKLEQENKELKKYFDEIKK